MKQIIRIFAILAAVATAACQTDAADGTQSAMDGYVRFSSGNISQSRTVIGKEGDALTVEWNSGDLIGIYGASDAQSLGNNYPYEVQDINKETGTCIFCYLNPGQTFQNPAKGNAYYAYYPYNEDAGKSPEAVPLSLPAEQYQRMAGTTESLAELGFMKAIPSAITDPASGVNFEFHNVFAIVELKLRMNAASSMNNVPIQSIRMTSSSSDLIAPQAEIDLTAPVETGYTVIPVTVKEGGGKSVNLTFDQTAQLTKQDGSFYFVVLPGNHPAGTITLEVTAIDNSVNKVVLPGDVEFCSNRHYTKNVELALDGFQQAEQFDVTPAALTVKAGEMLQFDFSGKASGIVFWSGEKGHDYELSDVGATLESTVSLNFSSQYVNGMSRNCGSVKYSTDFGGDYTEASVKAATWTDVSDKFTLPPYISATSTAVDPEANTYGSDPYDSGTVDITLWFKDYETPVYFAFFYHIDTYDANFVDAKTGIQGNGRSYWDIHTLISSAAYPNDPTAIPLIDMNANDQSPVEIIHTSSYNSETDANKCKKGISAAKTKVIRMTSSFRPTSDRDAYCISHAFYRPAAKISPTDSGVEVPTTGDEYGYVFAQPGVYNVVFVVTTPSLAGDNEVVKRFEITVTE